MFGMDLYELGPDHGELHSWNQIEVAVDCWFTSAGRMMPLRMKCREGDRILTIEPIAVLKEEENRYAGVDSLLNSAMAFDTIKCVDLYKICSGKQILQGKAQL